MIEGDEEYRFIEATLRAGITDAYRYGIGAAIATIQLFRGSTLDVETLDRVIYELRRLSAGAERNHGRAMAQRGCLRWRG
ncbi:MAG: hypothetical protein ACOYMG_19835, partial [Candidatus Methylumidiphilus sp.]